MTPCPTAALAILALATSGCIGEQELLGRVESDAAAPASPPDGFETSTIPVGCGPSLHVIAAEAQPTGGATDLLVAGGDCLAVVPGIGGGWFGTAEIAVAAPAGNGIAAGLVTSGDGAVDVVGHAATTRLFLGDGNGGFQTGTAPLGTGVAGWAGWLALADLDGNDTLDVIASTGTGISAWRGDGTGMMSKSFGAKVAESFGLAAGDLNGDGVPDLAVAVDGLKLSLGTGAGTFTAAKQPVLPAGAGPVRGVAIGQLDSGKDACPDLITWPGIPNGVADDQGNSIVLLGACNGDAVVAGTLDLGAVSHAVLADLDGDGVVDVIGAEPSRGVVVIARGRGDGSFEAPLQLDIGGRPETVAVADLNQDGRLDIAAASSAVPEGEVRLLLQLLPVAP